jgi:hypothetical protein
MESSIDVLIGSWPPLVAESLDHALESLVQGPATVGLTNKSERSNDTARTHTFSRCHLAVVASFLAAAPEAPLTESPV